MRNEISDPFKVFDQYYKEATNVVEGEDLESMTLSTSTPDGKPHSRVVLFKGIYAGNFLFFTNYRSQKALDIEANPHVALLFHWPALRYQIRVEGTAVKAPRDITQHYWDSRSHDKQAAGALSEQSSRLDSFEHFVEKYEKLRAKLTPILCPPHWGGYLIKPNYFEFWKGSPIRIHRRKVFELDQQNWSTYYLQP